MILDEIGRGTATFDGLSIAWAVVEQLHDVNRCRGLFATHYHELAQLEGRLDHLANLSLRAREWNGDLVFLHEAVAENVVAAPAMGRRATYQFGMLLPADEQGHVDQGLGKGVPTGSSALVPPTIEITETGQELVLDGVRIEFQ